jgi:hypothetical protein
MFDRPSAIAASGNQHYCDGGSTDYSTIPGQVIMTYSGIDPHSNNSLVSVIDETDRVVAEKRLPNDPS